MDNPKYLHYRIYREGKVRNHLALLNSETGLEDTVHNSHFFLYLNICEGGIIRIYCFFQERIRLKNIFKKYLNESQISLTLILRKAGKVRCGGARPRSRHFKILMVPFSQEAFVPPSHACPEGQSIHVSFPSFSWKVPSSHGTGSAVPFPGQK